MANKKYWTAKEMQSKWEQQDRFNKFMIERWAFVEKDWTIFINTEYKYSFQSLMDEFKKDYL